MRLRNLELVCYFYQLKNANLLEFKLAYIIYFFIKDIRQIIRLSILHLHALKGI